MLYGLIVFLPLIGAILAGIFGRWLGDRGAQMATTGMVTAAALLSWPAFFIVALQGHPTTVDLLPWIVSGDFEAMWSLRVDQLTAVMLVVVTSVAALVYYLRPAMLMFMPDRTPAREYGLGQRAPTALAVTLGVAGVTVLGLLPNLWYAFVAHPDIWAMLDGR